jgi:thioredoxin-dependent peroxiredoxin
MPFMRRCLSFGVLVAALLTSGASSLRGDNEEVHYYVQVGARGPEWTAVDDQGKKWTSTAHVGKWVLVLFFYEGDFMANCTRQARDMETLHKQIRAEGAELIGISGDSAETHQLFRKTNKLTYRLLCDYEGKMTYRYGVAKSGGGVRRIKDSSGDEIEIRRGCTPARWTFIIDREGKVVYKKINVDPATHAREVLSFVRKLNLPK